MPYLLLARLLIVTLIIIIILCVTHNAWSVHDIKECMNFSPTLKGSSKPPPPPKHFQFTKWAFYFGIFKLRILALNCKALLLSEPMATTITSLLAWLAQISIPLLAWLAKYFPSLSTCWSTKSHLSPFVYCGKCGTSCSWLECWWWC